MSVINRAEENRYGFSYFDKLNEDRELDNENEEDEREEFDPDSCAKECCDNDCECDDCMRCAANSIRTDEEDSVGFPPAAA